MKPSKATSKATSKKKSKEKCKIMAEVLPALSPSVHGDDMSVAIDATKSTALLEDVLKANGEEHLFDTIMELSVYVEDGPPVIFGWQNVEEFVRAIQTAQTQAAAPGGVPLPPSPLTLPTTVNVQNFKEAVLEYARIHGAPSRLETTCLPCSLAHFGQVTFMLQRLDLSQWIQHIIRVGGPNVLPIACVYVPRPRSNTLDRATPQLPNSLWS